MARYRVLYVGHYDTMYDNESNLYDDDNGNCGVLGDYGSVFNGLCVKGEADLTFKGKIKDIDWDNSYEPSAVYIREIDEVFSLNDSFMSPAYTLGIKEFIIKYKDLIREYSEVVMLSVHV